MITNNESQKNPNGFYIHIGFKKNQSTGLLKQVLEYIAHILTDNIITRIPAHVLMFVQTQNFYREPSEQVKEIYAKLKAAYQADQTLKALEASGQLQDKLFISARKAFLELAQYIEQNRKNSEKRFENVSTDHAERLLQCMEWKSQDSPETSYETIQRIYRKSHNIINQEDNVIGREEAKAYEMKFNEMHSEMHQAFYDFRKEVVAYQNSFFRVASGLFDDTKILSCHDRMMNIFNRFVDEKKYP
jgi:hypothetical protein